MNVPCVCHTRHTELCKNISVTLTSYVPKNSGTQSISFTHVVGALAYSSRESYAPSPFIDSKMSRISAVGLVIRHLLSLIGRSI